MNLGQHLARLARKEYSIGARLAAFRPNPRSPRHYNSRSWVV